MVDYLTDIFEVEELPSTLSSVVIHALKQQVEQYGFPLVVHSDGGQQFKSEEFRAFSKLWGFSHSVSSSYHSQSNGKAGQR